MTPEQLDKLVSVIRVWAAINGVMLLFIWLLLAIGVLMIRDYLKAILVQLKIIAPRV